MPDYTKWKSVKYVIESPTKAYADFRPYKTDFENNRINNIKIGEFRYYISNGNVGDTFTASFVIKNYYTINDTWEVRRETGEATRGVSVSSKYMFITKDDMARFNYLIPIEITSRNDNRISFNEYINVNSYPMGGDFTTSIFTSETSYTVDNINLSTKLLTQPILVTYNPPVTGKFNQYNINVYDESNNSIFSYLGTNTPVIPQGLLHPKQYRFSCCYSTVLNDGTLMYNTPIKDFNFGDFSIPKPTIDNLLQVGEYWEQQIEINFRSENQTGYEYELYQNNNKIGNGTGAYDKRFFIAANTFTSKHNCTVRVRVKNEAYGIIEWSNWQEINLRLKDIQPTVENLTISGSNIDYPITVSVDSTYQEQLVIEVWKDDVKVKEYTTTTEKQVIIPANALTIGLHKFKAKVCYKGRWTNYIEINATLTETLPSIGAFEPDGTAVKRDDYIKIWWFPLNQSKWKLTIDGTITYTGTTEKELILPPATLFVGNHNMVLEVWFVSVGGVQKPPAVKKAEFVVRGKPSIPTILSSNKFSSNRPTFIWDSNGQQGYLLQVLDSNNKLVYDTEWKNGLIVEHRIATYLEDGNYTVRIKVMNVQSEESEWGTQKFTITTVKPKQINLSHIIYDNSIGLTWDNPNNAYSMFYIFRNDKIIAKTNNTKFEDYTCNKECLYFVRGVNENDIYSDSNRVYAEISIRYGIMATVDNVEDFINVGISRNQWQFNGNINIENNMINLTGREYPVAIFGEHTQEAYTLNFVAEDEFKFIEMCKRREVFCYRDKRQTLYLTVPNPSYNIDRFGCTYSIQAHTVNYSEVIEYE